MRHVDASSIVHAWDTYPIAQIPRLWEWLRRKITEPDLNICTVAFGEVQHVSPDCATWLTDSGITLLDITDAITGEALRIKRALGIQGENYHPRGVDENDLIIVASARVWGAPLLSEEALQPTLPPLQARYKIPAVCGAHGVRCSRFIDFMKESREVF
jgi:hypothetical protein